MKYYSRFYRKSAALMWGYFCPKTLPAKPTALNTTSTLANTLPLNEYLLDTTQNEGIFTGYAFDQTDDNDGDQANSGADVFDNSDPANNPAIENTAPAIGTGPSAMGLLVAHDDIIPPKEIDPGIAEQQRCSKIIEDSIHKPKHCRLEILARVQLQGRKNRLFFIRIDALWRIEKLFNAKKSPFDGGHNGLQAYRVHAIHGCLHMLLWNDHRQIDASERAAEAQGFAARWGGRQVCAWAESWVNQGELPVSWRGKHIKVFMFLEDPDICTELQSYVCSNKWAIDPANLANFTAQKIIPTAAKAYGTHLIMDEIPRSLKRYLELELFPRIHMKAV